MAVRKYNELSYYSGQSLRRINHGAVALWSLSCAQMTATNAYAAGYCVALCDIVKAYLVGFVTNPTLGGLWLWVATDAVSSVGG